MALAEPTDEWLAGLLEGEGSFGFNYSGRPCVQVQMGDADVVAAAARLMGGRLLGPYTRPTRPSNKAMYHAKRVGAPAIEVMERVWPWMGARRTARISEILGSPAPSAKERGVEWLAGLLEGEGSFYSQPSNPHSVQLSMTDRDVVECAAHMMNAGGVHLRSGDSRPSHWRPCWSTRVRKAHAEELLITLLPYMGERRSIRIRELLGGQ